MVLFLNNLDIQQIKLLFSLEKGRGLFHALYNQLLPTANEHRSLNQTSVSLETFFVDTRVSPTLMHGRFMHYASDCWRFYTLFQCCGYRLLAHSLVIKITMYLCYIITVSKYESNDGAEQYQWLCFEKFIVCKYCVVVDDVARMPTWKSYCKFKIFTFIVKFFIWHFMVENIYKLHVYFTSTEDTQQLQSIFKKVDSLTS